MRYLVNVLAVAAFFIGMLAAWYWLRASRVRIDTGWGRNGLIEPVVHSVAQDVWIMALIQAASESARLNEIAAIWTAVAVALNALAGFAWIWT